jgi:2,4-dienoyl-CoA reductase-like NADH-dependent reductase (Old Yellow Enzyme family)
MQKKDAAGRPDGRPIKIPGLKKAAMEIKKTESVLFSPIQVGRMAVPNRFVRSATHDFMAGEDGSVSPRQVSLFRQLAEGEIGLIITGHAYVVLSGKASPRQIGVDDDRLLDGLSQIPRAVHEYPSRVFLQISHAGRQTKEKLCGCTPLAPSAVYEPVLKVMPRMVTSEEVVALIAAFVAAASRASLAGFDGVQVHAAHGYLLSAFLSPHTNRREDKWGGTLENRTRMIVEIVRGIKKRAGAEFPVIIKLNSSDFLPGGLTIDDSVAAAQRLEQAGADGIEVSGGMTEAGKGSVWPGLRPEREEGYFVPNAAIIKAAVKVPVFGLGGLRSFSMMERLVGEGKVDLISLSRPLVRDPFLIRRFHSGEIRRSECISCNKCFNPRGISCAELKKRG